MNEITDVNIVEIIEKAIDRSKWEKFIFSDLFENVVEKVVPKNSGLEHYIGLEHLDSGSLHIKRFGDTSSLIGDKLKIYKGDIIFAKRNAYLKRASIAPFDAVASAHSLVLRPKEKNVLPEFIPFFLMSEKFWERAIEISVGSLSPTINWKSLAKQEFLLPPKDQQAQLAELLWAMDEVIEREREMLDKIELTYKVKSKTLFNNLKSSLDYKKLGDICVIERGGSPRPIDDYITSDVDGLNWIKIGDVAIESKYITHTKQKIKPSGLKKTRQVYKGDLLLSNSMSFGRPYILEIDGCIHDGWLVIHDKNNKFDKDFLYYYLSSESVFRQFETFAAGGVVSNLNKEIVKKLKVYLPSKDIQIQIKETLSFLESSSNNIKSKLLSSQSLQKSIINQVF